MADQQKMRKDFVQSWLYLQKCLGASPLVALELLLGVYELKIVKK